MSTVERIAPWIDVDGMPEGALQKLCDLALFEPDKSSGRVLDRFLKDQDGNLLEEEHALANRIAGARFSIVRVGERLRR